VVGRKDTTKENKILSKIRINSDLKLNKKKAQQVYIKLLVGQMD